MALTPTQKRHAIRQANKWMAIKLKSERPFVRELRSYFFKQSKRIAAGSLPTSIQPLLDKQYKRIVRNTSGVRLKQEEEDDYGLEAAIILLLLNRSLIQSSIIDKTTVKNLREARETARKTLADQGNVIPTDRELNTVTSRIFKSRNRGRVGNISVTETQMLTEKIKDVMEDVGDDMMNDAIVNGDQALGRRAADMLGSETAKDVADDIGTVSNFELFLVMAVLQHTWVTMGDSKVRPWHQTANFQTVPRNEPFLVMNQNLMYPGDTSMGATMENISHCRCVEIIL